MSKFFFGSREVRFIIMPRTTVSFLLRILNWHSIDWLIGLNLRNGLGYSLLPKEEVEIQLTDWLINELPLKSFRQVNYSGSALLQNSKVCLSQQQGAGVLR